MICWLYKDGPYTLGQGWQHVIHTLPELSSEGLMLFFPTKTQFPDSKRALT